ncbi:hypothetical protein D3C86_1720600 [compost metagenome]
MHKYDQTVDQLLDIDEVDSADVSIQFVDQDEGFFDVSITLNNFAELCLVTATALEEGLDLVEVFLRNQCDVLRQIPDTRLCFQTIRFVESNRQFGVDRLESDLSGFNSREDGLDQEP